MEPFYSLKKEDEKSRQTMKPRGIQTPASKMRAIRTTVHQVFSLGTRSMSFLKNIKSANLAEKMATHTSTEAACSNLSYRKKTSAAGKGMSCRLAYICR